MKRVVSAIVVFLGMLVLILDGKTAVLGAGEGIRLCTDVVIPSLFPFFFLSIWITGNLYGMNMRFLRPLGRLCNIPAGAESILLVGFLGGYPVGAQAVTSLWRSGVLDKEKAQRMLGFCSNAGPGFLFGMAASLFSQDWMGWCLWGIHILGAIGAAIILCPSTAGTVQISARDPIEATNVLHQTLRVMASVCGWIILFRVLIAFADRWGLCMVPVPVRVAILGILELSNGCCVLGEIPSESLRFILCAGILSFGGCCVTMQTVSVTSGLSMKYYWYGKGIQTVLSLVLAWTAVYGIWPVCLALLPICLFVLRKIQNTSSILKPVGV